MKNISLIALSAFVFLSVISCQPKRTYTPATQPDNTTENTLKAADFNTDSAYFFVEKQVSFGPRVPNTPAHEQCAQWLVKKLKEYTANVTVQIFEARAYNGVKLNGKNIIASFNPKSPARVLLCAHWDSRPYADNDPNPANHTKPIAGANDGASGVGVLLETARQLKIKAPTTGVDILLLDLEDYGAPKDANFNGADDWALGSQYWSNNPHTNPYKANYGILLDMVGASGATFKQEAVTMNYAPDVAKRVWDVASQLGYSSYFVTEQVNGVTDDHLYINQVLKIPTIDIIQNDASTETGFYQFWHTTFDNMQGIDKATLMAVGQTVLTTVYEGK